MTIHFHPVPNHPRANVRVSQKQREIVHDDLRASVKEEPEQREPISENPRPWWVS
jgi:hypothetical protein